MVHKIAVDDEVYALLELNAKGFEQPNDVLRRLLLPSSEPPERTPASTTPAARASSGSTTGRLAPLLLAGLIHVGDQLRYEQVRKGLVFFGSVESGGLIATEKDTYTTPSPALADLVGSQIDGWRNWIHVPSEKSLDQLRKQLPR